MLKRTAPNKSKKTMMNAKSNRFLITINVLGSTGPIRFVVNEDDLVCKVIKTTLTSYAHQARLPALGSDANNFLLHCVNDGADALSPWETIGSKQVRQFLLCKKEGFSNVLTNEKMSKKLGEKKGSNGLKTWLNKSLSHHVQFHCML